MSNQTTNKRLLQALEGQLELNSQLEKDLNYHRNLARTRLLKIKSLKQKVNFMNDRITELENKISEYAENIREMLKSVYK